jgi:transposase, IS5 family
LRRTYPQRNSDERQAIIQTRSFTLSDRYAQLEKLGDPLPKLNAIVEWESFRRPIEKCRGAGDRRSNAGHKTNDAILLLKMVALQQL